MIHGVVYKLESPEGKCYIGQTISYKRRLYQFHSKNKKMAYGGVLIKKAVERFGCNNFKYEILFELDFDTKDEAKGVLHEKEMYYIEKYDTFNNGYNMTKGGVWGKRFYPIRR